MAEICGDFDTTSGYHNNRTHKNGKQCIAGNGKISAMAKPGNKVVIDNGRGIAACSDKSKFSNVTTGNGSISVNCLNESDAKKLLEYQKRSRASADEWLDSAINQVT